MAAMYWEHLWVRMAISTEKTTSVRILETSKRLAWTAYNGQPYVYEAMPINETLKPNPGGGTGAMVRSSGQMAHEQLPVEVWTRCLDSLGSDGWELVTVTPLSGDVRVEQIYANDRDRDRLGPQAAIGKAGHHDVQLWVFKRERPYGTLPDEASARDEDDADGEE